MKIIDCTTFFQEKLMMEVRFNILDPYVDKFIVCEARFTHSGNKKSINFDPNDYPDFKKKITHIVLEKEPDDIKKIQNERLKSVKRIEYQRNYLINGLKDCSKDDLIIYSDNDEIPNLNKLDKNKIKNKIILFEQDLFYYKFNLFLKDHIWYGSKACRLKDLINIDWLRMIKNKKYEFFRLDTIFSKNKYQNISIIKNGGWHFSNLKSLKDLMIKYQNDENYSEFVQKGYDKKYIEQLINKKAIGHNHKADKKSEEKFSEISLEKYNLEKLPLYLQANAEKYASWFD